MRGHGLSALAGAAMIAAVVGTTPAQAATRQQIDWCENKVGEVSFELEISGCTAAIESGKWSGKNLAWAFSNRCNAENQTNNYDSAIADCTQAIHLDPNFSNAHLNRGNSYTDGKHDDDRGIADYNEAIRLNPNAKQAYNGRGNAYYHKN